MQFNNLVYVLTCLVFSVIIGAAVYEHVALWPTAFAELPRSLSLFQGAYKFDNGIFWMAIHPITLGMFFITWIMNRKTGRHKFVLAPLLVYALVLMVTFFYFVPELLSLVNTPYADSYDEALTSRASLWVYLSIARMMVLIVAAILLYMGLTKPLAEERYRPAPDGK